MIEGMKGSVMRPLERLDPRVDPGAGGKKGSIKSEKGKGRESILDSPQKFMVMSNGRDCLTWVVR